MAKRNDGGLFLPGHDGRPKAAPNQPGMHGPALGDAFVGHHVPGNIARDGAPKRHNSAPIHGGMTARQTDLLGMGHALGSAPDASSSNPMDPTTVAKTIVPAPVHPSMRSRSLDRLGGAAPGENHVRNRGAHLADAAIGRQILAEAHSAPDDRRALAHLGVGSALPLTVKSK